MSIHTMRLCFLSSQMDYMVISGAVYIAPAIATATATAVATVTSQMNGFHAHSLRL